ncbi:MAG: hypothetical protein HQL10_00655 [Nitrospirae bacterium]|nr:hypothetical protein [Nitrospirota bacterium]
MKKTSEFNIVVLLLSILIVLSGSGCKQEQLNSPVIANPSQNDVVSTTTVLDSFAAGVNTDNLIIEMNPYGKGVAYIESVDGQMRVVHNGKKGKLYQVVESNMALSPDGRRVAYGARLGEKWFIVIDGNEEGPFEEKGQPVFSPDSKHVAYEAKVRGLWHMFVNKKAGPSIPVYFNDKATFSSDSSRLLSLENSADHTGIVLHVTDLSFNRLGYRMVRGKIIVVDPTKTRIAAVDVIKGKHKVIEFSFGQPDNVKEGALYDEVSHLVFGSEGNSLSYIAKKDGKFYLVLNDKEELIPDGTYPSPPVIRPDNKGAGLLITGKDGAYFHQAFYSDGSKRIFYKECGSLTYSKDGRFHSYVAIRNEKFTIVVNGKEGPFFDRVMEPQFSPDGKYVAYRARHGEERFVVVADTNGKIVKKHSSYDRVFETVFTDDGKSIAYGVIDGDKLIWKVERLDNR